MSEEPKKYPADTPLTLQMMVELYEAEGSQSLANRWRKFIEPPKPDPKEGEFWLCNIGDSRRIGGLWYGPNGWFFYKDKNSIPFNNNEIAPIKRLIPAEDEE